MYDEYISIWYVHCMEMSAADICMNMTTSLYAWIYQNLIWIVWLYHQLIYAWVSQHICVNVSASNICIAGIYQHLIYVEFYSIYVCMTTSACNICVAWRYQLLIYAWIWQHLSLSLCIYAWTHEHVIYAWIRQHPYMYEYISM